MAKPGYTKGSYGLDAKGNRVSVNSPTAVRTVGGSPTRAAAPAPAAPATPAAPSAPASPVGPLSFSYVDQGGATRSVSAASADEALRTAPGIAKNSGVIQNTDAQRTETADRMSSLDERERRRQERQAKKDAEKAARDAERAKADAPSADEAAADAYGISSEIADLEANAEKRIKEINRTLDSIEAGFDESSQQLVAGLRAKYGARIEEMKDSNKRLLATKTQMGLREGRSRYAPIVEADILTDEEIAGHGRIATLEGEMLVAVAEAQQARMEGKLANFNARYDRIEQIEKSMKAEVKDLFQRAVDREKAIREEQKAERDALKAQLDASYDLSERAAPALAERVAGMSEATRQAVIAEYAAAQGIDPAVLESDVALALRTKRKDELDMANTSSLIADRNKPKDTDGETTFKASATDVSKVKTWLAQNGQPGDFDAAKTDEEFFYYILGKAQTI